MVYFREHINSRKKYLVILKDKDQPIKNGVMILVGEQKHGDFAKPWPYLDKSSSLRSWSVERSSDHDPSRTIWILQFSIHKKHFNEEPELTLGRRMISGNVRWGSQLKIYGEFFYIKFYWEWLEMILSRNEEILHKAHLFDAVIASLYSYDRNSDVVRAFCEAWCPSTNTLHTSAGELSISLWDLWKFGGLTIKGRFYDEVVPCCKELTSYPDQEGRPFRICEYLFTAYYHLVYSKEVRSKVLVGSWISFWFKGKSIYPKPPTRKAKKTTRPHSTYNPDSFSYKKRDWTNEEENLFHRLGVEDEFKEHTYLAAFLSCWLCVFVFPFESINYVRPEVFKVASFMAEGYCFSLAIPVLANIYNGLGHISNAHHSAGCYEACFPVHYVYGWLAHYFDTYYKVPKKVRGPMMVNYSGEGGAKYFTDIEARSLIYKGDSIAWHVNLHFRNKGELVIDDHLLTPINSSYFISIRSCYLSSRYGNSITIESYSPYRFSRQFGFYQDIPGDLEGNMPLVNLDNILHLWKICVQDKTLSKVYFPAQSSNPHYQVTRRFLNWWSHKHGDYLENGIQTLLMNALLPLSKPKRSKDVCASKDNGGKKNCLLEAGILQPQVLEDKSESHSSNTDHHWKRAKKLKRPSLSHGVPIASNFPNQAVDLEIQQECNDHSFMSPDAFNVVVARVQTPKASKKGEVEEQNRRKVVCTTPSEMSNFCADDVIFNFRRQASLAMWESVQQKLIRTPFDKVPLLEQEVHKIFSAISEYNMIDLVSLQNIVNEYFHKVKKYNDLRSSLSSRLTIEDRDRQLAELRVCLEKISSNEIDRKAKQCAFQERSIKVLSKIEELEAELKTLKDENKEIERLMLEDEGISKDQIFEAAKVHGEINIIENTPTVSDADVKALELLRQLLDDTRQELKDYQWFP